MLKAQGTWLYLLFAVCASALFASVAKAGAFSTVVSGYNLDAPGTTIPVPFIPTAQGYELDVQLYFDPAAGPMTKNFQGPLDVTGVPLVISNTQPNLFHIDENYTLVAPAPPELLPGVKDWHERILTPGWAWAPSPLPTTLITRNGQPWPSAPEDVPPLTPLTAPPTQLDIVFEEITPGNVLDIHKALTWIGTAENPVWGDSPSETTISVLEYPTPEPASIVLAALGTMGLLLARRRSRRGSLRTVPV